MIFDSNEWLIRLIGFFLMFPRIRCFFLVRIRFFLILVVICCFVLPFSLILFFLILFHFLSPPSLLLDEREVRGVLLAIVFKAMT
jgi:hypothetical protein